MRFCPGKSGSSASDEEVEGDLSLFLGGCNRKRVAVLFHSLSRDDVICPEIISKFWTFHLQTESHAQPLSSHAQPSFHAF